MKIGFLIPALCVAPCAAFAPSGTVRTSIPSFGITAKRVCNKESFVRLNEQKVPFFAAMNEDKDAPSAEEEVELDAMTEAEEIEELVKKEMAKTKRMSNLRNEKGVDYAPWMNISEEDEAKIRQLMKEKTIARRARKLQEQTVKGNLYYDSQAQELSGTGLNTKIIDTDVELEWGTKSEVDCAGFVVRRRPAKTEEFSVLATYKDFGPLVSQGPQGGIYRFFDDTCTPGGWVYRVSEVSTNGQESDLCQCLVEVQTEDEQRAALFAGVGFAVLAVVAVVGGILLDPMNGK
eukprot:CAMPEP_0195515648 /NCGR_PEP_ID=MMETSP0794_2-20130614/6643_1 /TAXON_ID=515487 /ORGANISM="Stephanopyxis turris, Strain CCMP 815" /LENGTH=289 /DNA_ID=CAMNT_0040644103 /DNA_START=68 /DNA_END=937 /DNA_ORIENTATION=-